MKRKGQVSILYLVITLAIAFVISAGVFLFAKSFQSSLGGDIADFGLDRVAQQLENGFLDLKLITDTTNDSTINLTIPLSGEIGEQRYTIAADGSNVLELRTLGDPSVFRLLELKFWPDVEVFGLVDSSQGFVKLQLNLSTAIIE